MAAVGPAPDSKKVKKKEDDSSSSSSEDEGPGGKAGKAALKLTSYCVENVDPKDIPCLSQIPLADTIVPLLCCCCKIGFKIKKYRDKKKKKERKEAKKAAKLAAAAATAAALEVQPQANGSGQQPTVITTHAQIETKLGEVQATVQVSNQ